MGGSKLTPMIADIKRSMVKNGPKILTGIGIVGMTTTVFLTAKGTIKAVKIVENEKKKHGEAIPKSEIVKATWKCYIPALITGVTSAGCLIKANSIHTRRNAALATAYSISRTALSEYKDKVIETIGEKKERVIRENIAQDKLDKNPVSKSEIIITDKGPTLCYDGVFGRYFKSDIDTIKKAVNKINRTVVTQMYVSLNDFYDEIGLEPVDIGYDLGWNIDDGEIEVEFDSKLADDKTPCLVIMYNVAPKYGYSKFF